VCNRSFISKQPHQCTTTKTGITVFRISTELGLSERLPGRLRPCGQRMCQRRAWILQCLVSNHNGGGVVYISSVDIFCKSGNGRSMHAVLFHSTSKPANCEPPLPPDSTRAECACSRHDAPTAKEPEHDWVHKTDTGFRQATLELGGHNIMCCCYE
jgi:hypothetical protein